MKFKDLLTTAGLALFSSCQKKEASQQSTNGTSPASQTTPATDGTKDQGASSGGGGYVTKNSKKLLKIVVEEIALEIKQASPFLFNDLPDGWNQLKLSAQVSVPLMEITANAPSDAKTMYDNLAAPRGRYIGINKDFPLKCDYFGKR